jgi:hypothetical protein
MEARSAIKRRSSFGKMNRICELETAKAFFRQLQATLAEKRGLSVKVSPRENGDDRDSVFILKVTEIRPKTVSRRRFAAATKALRPR